MKEEEEKKFPAKVGRPTKYKEEYNHICKCLAKDGKTEVQIAEIIGVDQSTITEWENVYPEFSAALKTGRAEHDDTTVVNSLLKRAKGYTRIIQRLDKNGEPVDCKEELPPDPTSMIFWLKNRQSKHWRDRQDVEHSGSVNITPIFNINLKQK